MPAVQSDRPEDTRFAREHELVAVEEDGEEEELTELSLEDIRDCDDDTLEKVPTPEWGGFVFVRNRSGADRNHFEQESARRQGGRRKPRAAAMKDLLERLVVFGSCTSKREPLFSAKDIEWLRDKNAAPIGRIADTVLRLNGWTEGDLENMVGNSPSGPNLSATSD
ncbi:MAG TPA: hypothetical protein VMX74_16055 [Pirellulales bacterium]|nr:hypothetical protein [Pirellulales bacterium]